MPLLAKTSSPVRRVPCATSTRSTSPNRSRSRARARPPTASHRVFARRFSRAGCDPVTSFRRPAPSHPQWGSRAEPSCASTTSSRARATSIPSQGRAPSSRRTSPRASATGTPSRRARRARRTRRARRASSAPSAAPRPAMCSSCAPASPRRRRFHAPTGHPPGAGRSRATSHPATHRHPASNRCASR
jgi:hypothetical protein